MGNDSKIVVRIFILTFISTIVFSCWSNVRTNNFYCDSKADIDVWRIPVIRPIELISADFKSSTWNLVTYPHVDMPHISHSVDSINYYSGKILLFSPYERFVIIDLTLHFDTAFSLRSDFVRYTEENRFPSKLYNVSELYASWIDTKNLPWINQINDRIECDVVN
jgi:hypothetical protein